jgi:penicillin-binding protein 1C
VVQASVSFATTSATSPAAAAPEAPRREWFLAGTQQTTFAIDSTFDSPYSTWDRGQNNLKHSDQTAARIAAPTNGTIIALDPDIPPKNQRVSLTAVGANLRWLMDGKPLAKGTSAQWLPWPGRHVVQLVGSHGEVLDEVRLEVRGAGVKVGAVATK